jgi:AraC family transcriptional regulator
MMIAGHLRRHTPETLSQLPTQWYELQAQLAMMTGTVGGDAYGLWYGLTGGTRQFTYLTGVRVGEFAPIPSHMSRTRLDPLHFAIFAHQGSHLEVRRTVEAVLSQWLPSSGRERSPVEALPDVIEWYSEQFNKTGQGPIEVWLPLKK